jgi:primosomal protein N' (replication factor Y)
VALDGDARLTPGQRAMLERLRDAGPLPAAGDHALLRRLEARGLVALEREVRRRAPRHVSVGARGGAVALTQAQEAALAPVREAIAAGAGGRFLLHGVTGSGKTEVYLRAVEAALAHGRGAIVLVPEIALTPQTVGRVRARFGEAVAVLHSALGDGERHDEWLRLRRGEARVCVGPRSAVFAPIAGLGLVVIDEEHDAAFKQESDPRYDARTVAERRGAVVLAGSATPRPETVHAYRRLRLSERVDGRALPPVEVLDMRECAGPLHPRAREALAAVRGAGEKAIVLLNRRGWSNFLTCRSCARVWECPQCDVALVLHRAAGTVACHHCGHREPVPRVCGACGSTAVARHGAGTERLEHDLVAALGEPSFPVFRLDSDVTGARVEVLAAFEAAPAGLLLGTQMVAKGHDFPDVTLGVVLDADATLRFPDFRAEERTFALVAQLAGRAGRGPRGGRVLVQTLAPDAPCIRLAAAHDADGFLAAELARREALRYPPFSHLIRVVCSALDAGAATAAAAAVRAALTLPDAQVLGPAPLFRLRGRERAQLVLKVADRAEAAGAVGAAVDATARARRGVAFSVDVDPQ